MSSVIRTSLHSAATGAFRRFLPSTSSSSAAAKATTVANAVSMSRCQLIISRNMGGARPGGVPTFNWKEKRALGIEEGAFAVKKVKKFNPEEGIYGEFEEQSILGGKAPSVEVEVEEGFDSSQYAPVDGNQGDVREVPVAEPAAVDCQRTEQSINTGALFGSIKSMQRTYAVDKRKHNYKRRPPLAKPSANPHFQDKYHI